MSRIPPRLLIIGRRPLKWICSMETSFDHFSTMSAATRQLTERRRYLDNSHCSHGIDRTIMLVPEVLLEALVHHSKRPHLMGKTMDGLCFPLHTSAMFRSDCKHGLERETVVQGELPKDLWQRTQILSLKPR
jgi:hypothetical protein